MKDNINQTPLFYKTTKKERYIRTEHCPFSSIVQPSQHLASHSTLVTFKK